MKYPPLCYPSRRVRRRPWRQHDGFRVKENAILDPDELHEFLATLGFGTASVAERYRLELESA